MTHAQKTNLNHLDEFKNAQNVIILGSAINYQVPTLRYMLNNKLKLQKGSNAIYMHPLNDTLMTSLSKSLTHIAYREDALSVAVGAIALAYLENVENNEDAESHTLRQILAPLLESKTTITTPIEREVKKTITSTNEAGEDTTRDYRNNKRDQRRSEVSSLA